MTELETLQQENEVLHSMIEHYKECITKQLEKIKDQEDLIAELCRSKD